MNKGASEPAKTPADHFYKTPYGAGRPDHEISDAFSDGYKKFCYFNKYFLVPRKSVKSRLVIAVTSLSSIEALCSFNAAFPEDLINTYNNRIKLCNRYCSVSSIQEALKLHKARSDSVGGCHAAHEEMEPGETYILIGELP